MISYKILIICFLLSSHYLFSLKNDFFDFDKEITNLLTDSVITADVAQHQKRQLYVKYLKQISENYEYFSKTYDDEIYAQIPAFEHMKKLMETYYTWKMVRYFHIEKWQVNILKLQKSSFADDVIRDDQRAFLSFFNEKQNQLSDDEFEKLSKKYIERSAKKILEKMIQFSDIAEMQVS